MAALDQQTQGRLKVPQEPEVAGSEQNFHDVWACRLHAVNRGGLNLSEVAEATDQYDQDEQA